MEDRGSYHVRTRRLAIALLCCALALTAACSRPGTVVHRIEGFAQGTSWRAAVVAAPGFDAAALGRAIDAEFAAIDLAWSNYRDDSVIERFNALETTAPFAAGEGIVELVRKAAHVFLASRGCFDPTVGPLKGLWDLDAAAADLPDPAAIEQAMEAVGLNRVDIVDATRVRKLDSTVRLDLSGIAQGASVSRVGALVESHGIEAYFVELGGELQVRGEKPGGRPWRIAIRKPDDPGSARAGVIEYADDRPLAIATSGTYEQGFEADGRHYSHVLDPRTGRPVAHDTVSVTVAHADGALADAWSTALLCLGADAGRTVASVHDIAALFLSADATAVADRVRSGRGSERPGVGR